MEEEGILRLGDKVNERSERGLNERKGNQALMRKERTEP
jgi:hypothetical protein